MDRSNEEDVCTHPSQPASTTATTTDDESSLTTSTDSELLSTWTLVTDKTKQDHHHVVDEEQQAADDDNDDETKKSKAQKQQLADELKQAMKEAVVQRVEELHTPNDDQTDDDVYDEEDTKETKVDSTVDDFSDGISIISESDSGGRLSPAQFLSDLKFAENFQLNNDRIAKGVPILIAAAPELKQRKRKRSSSRNRQSDEAGDMQVQDALQPTNAALAVEHGEHLQRIVRRGLSGIFYVGVAVALLALYGKIRNPEWEPLSAAKQPMAELQQKVIDMELQNNLMRAEIDILSRQVNYLSNAKQTPPPPPQQQQQQQASMSTKDEKYHGKSKHFKAWSGNGERLEPIDISKGDLKRPYKCPNGQFVEIAGMCVENGKDSLVGGVSEVLETLRDDSDSVKHIEAETGQPLKDENQDASELPSHKYQTDFKHQNSREQVKQQRPHPNNNNNKENRYSKNGGGGGVADSKEQSRKRFKADSRESAERFQREKPSSKEQWRKAPPHAKGSGERFPKGSGEWHEKLMQQRESSRRQHEQKRNDKNWYIERGAGREHMRYS